MQKRFILLFILIFSISSTSAIFAQNIQSIAIGTAIPEGDLTLKDVSGKEVTLNDVKQKNGLLVMFSCNTCPFVIRNQARTKEICNYAKANGLGVILVNSNQGGRGESDSYEAMKTYASAQQYNMYYAADNKTRLADAFGAARTPEVFVFDKTDKLIYKGAIDDSPGDASKVSRHHLKEAIDATLSGKEVSLKESRSVGCGIKRTR